MKLINRMKKKLSSQKGESLAEVLVAMLVSTLGLVLLASMITASANIINTSKTTMKTYVQKENALAAGTGNSTSGTLEITKNGTSVNIAGNTSQIPVDYYVNDTFSNKPVVAYYVHSSH